MAAVYNIINDVVSMLGKPGLESRMMINVSLTYFLLDRGSTAANKVKLHYGY